MTQIFAWFLVTDIHACFGFLDIAIKSSHARREIATSMGNHDLETRHRIKQAFVDHRGRDLGFFDLLPDGIPERELVEPGIANAFWVDEYRHIERSDGFPQG